MAKVSDAAVAEALRIAREKLDKIGWKYTYEDIGYSARLILNGLYGEGWEKGE